MKILWLWEVVTCVQHHYHASVNGRILVTVVKMIVENRQSGGGDDGVILVLFLLARKPS